MFDSLNTLVYSSYYWPERSGNAPYVTGLAEYLSSRGHKVVVCTGFAHYPEWRSSAKSRLAARESRAGVEILRRRHYVPRKQSAARRALYESSLLLAGLTGVRLTERPDVVLGISPTLAAASLAVLTAKMQNRPVGLVFQDVVGRAAAQSGVKGGGVVAGTVREIELLLARRATRIAVTSDGFRRYFEEGGIDRSKIHLVRNWTLTTRSARPRDEMRARLGWTPDSFVCLYAGSLGRKQGLDNVLRCAKMLQTQGVKVVLAGDGSDRPRLARVSRGLNLENVEFYGVQPSGEYEAMLRSADVLLVNQRLAVTDMSLASKLTSYFAADKPVVAAVGPTSETAREVRASGGGLVVPAEQPELLASAILSLRANPAYARKLGARGRRYAQEHLSAETALARYEQFVETLHGGASSSPSERRLRRP
jgi:glycosyltransferase involved in cell wall biosynthesis